MEKKCSLCEQTLPIDMFYKSAGYKGGYTKRCKDCTKKKAREREEIVKSTSQGLEQERARHREKYYRLNYKGKHKPTPEKAKEYQEMYKERYPEKHKAKIVSSRLKPKEKGNHLHHWSYNEEHFKDVIELMPFEHAKAHRFIVYDQERRMYRRSDDMLLLDTRTKHVVYIYECINNKP
jgi:ATPase subunit of ABC transporter with duplicated ATPase domains